ncbi:hypothetical protein A6P39_042890 (plasmid) [Streptomyces sp. FXJ1.172]|uniref:hypothetical protein n=1 Tax=Streptomyces sp. FXJ1.172 TaxID=710705 RepID=UPI0023DCEF2D|nr:hypothetical protein [Streptomyces sp. FXJ1.172]WEP00911.1 hypothetical protein A6P39_042890 [Streptomyces sp. FXJ1.172]
MLSPEERSQLAAEFTTIDHLEPGRPESRPSPVARARSGSEHHLIVDRTGHPASETSLSAVTGCDTGPNGSPFLQKRWFAARVTEGLTSAIQVVPAPHREDESMCEHGRHMCMHLATADDQAGANHFFPKD